jgi:hypothetical protein
MFGVTYLNKIINMIMLTIYNELLMTNHLIGTSFVCGFQLINKKSLYLFEISLVALSLTFIFIIV